MGPTPGELLKVNSLSWYPWPLSLDLPFLHLYILRVLQLSVCGLGLQGVRAAFKGDRLNLES